MTLVSTAIDHGRSFFQKQILKVYPWGISKVVWNKEDWENYLEKQDYMLSIISTTLLRYSSVLSAKCYIFFSIDSSLR